MDSALIYISIQWQGALILASPFLIFLGFWMWKESSRIRNRWWKHQREVRELEDLICDARNVMVGYRIALETSEMKELVQEVEHFLQENDELPSRPDDMGIECDYHDLFGAKKLVESKPVEKRIETIWWERELEP